MPIQPSAAQGIKGHILMGKDFVEGLDDQLRGIFSNRAQKRPNPIGLSVLKLTRIELNRPDIENVEIIDGTPLLDIKPYVPEMNDVDNQRIGWPSRNNGIFIRINLIKDSNSLSKIT